MDRPADNDTVPAASTQEQGVKNNLRRTSERWSQCGSPLHVNTQSLSPSGGQYLSHCQTDCASLYHNGVRRSGVYNIVLLPGEMLPVYCDMETDGESRFLP